MRIDNDYKGLEMAKINLLFTSYVSLLKSQKFDAVNIKWFMQYILSY